MMNKDNGISDQAFATAAGTFFVFILVSKYKPAISSIYSENRIILITLFCLVVLGIILLIKRSLSKFFRSKNLEKEITTAKEGEDAIFAGFNESGKRIFIKHKFRRMHTQVVGTTNAGKTESIIVPWAVDDMKRGRGLIIIDGKSDRALLNKLYSYAKMYGREDDLKILSLCDVNISHTFNPLSAGSPLEVAERVFKAFIFDSEYYKSLQYEAFLQTLLIFEACGILPTPQKIVEFLRSPIQIKTLALKSEKKSQIDWAVEFTRLTREEREERTSGLISQLQLFSVGETSSVFNAENSDINLETALKDNHIIYCQLPVLKIPTLGKATGKLILQCLQSAIASRHLGRSDQNNHFSVFLDDFTEYLTDSFVSLLNKSRSAQVSVVFAHQALGDLAALGEDVKNSILTNANLKVFMRTNEPTSADYFSKVIGTSETKKLTERQKAGVLGASKTGDGSVREVEEYKFHPNLFKQKLGIGEAVVVIPHERGSLSARLQFRMLPDLSAPNIPNVQKLEPSSLPLLRTEDAQIQNVGRISTLLSTSDLHNSKEAA